MRKTVSKKIGGALAGAVLASLMTACGSALDSSDVAYAPPAYGQVVDNVYECYYITSPAEAYALENAGLCQRYAIPTPMPLTWEETWWDYWSSPAYYDTYIPVTYRRTYVSVTCVHFHQTYNSQIARLSKTAIYQSSSGRTVRGLSRSSFSTTTQRSMNYSVPKQSSRTYSYFKRR